MKKNIISETMKLLNEETSSQTVTLGNVKGKVYGQDELDCFNAIKNKIHGLESNVTALNIDLMLEDNTYIEFKTNDGAGEFIVIFSNKTFGKVINVQTTFSNQEITQDFLTLANELYTLKN